MKTTACILLASLLLWAHGAVAPSTRDQAFYVPANPQYSICDSVQDSLRFTAEKTLRPVEHGHLVSISIFVDSEGQVMGWHAFGNLERPGWVSNAVGGAYEMNPCGVTPRATSS
jgi:hypothetical protein